MNLTSYFLKAGLLIWFLPATFIVPHPLSMAVMLGLMFTTVTSQADGSLTLNFGGTP